MIQQQELTMRLCSGCRQVLAAQAEIDQISSRFGRGDLGKIMVEICTAMEDVMADHNGTLRVLFSSLSAAAGRVTGGSIVPLWSTWLQGMSLAAPESDTCSLTQFQDMLASGCRAIVGRSKAHPGDKTMLDALVPATRAVLTSTGSWQEILTAGAKAADQGAESTRNFVASFGQAANFGLQTLGTPDGGALVIKYFFQGLANL